MRERSGRQDVPERSGSNGLARRASAGNATNESGGEAEIAGGVGMRRGPRRGVYGALVGRLTAERRFGSASEEPLIRKEENREGSSRRKHAHSGYRDREVDWRPREITNGGGVLETDAARAKPG
jgi:hypothetical protein